MKRLPPENTLPLAPEVWSSPGLGLFPALAKRGPVGKSAASRWPQPGIVGAEGEPLLSVGEEGMEKGTWAPLSAV